MKLTQINYNETTSTVTMHQDGKLVGGVTGPIAREIHARHLKGVESQLRALGNAAKSKSYSHESRGNN